MEEYLTQSAEETQEVARRIGEKIGSNVVICFFGDLAAGKTTFIKGLAESAAQIDPSAVQSPTFTYLHIYQGTKTIYHFDLYRLRDVDEFLGMGFYDYFDADGICCIEWSEKIAMIIPQDCINITLMHLGGNKRKIILERKL